MRTILVTGFEPFGGSRRNPSEEVISALPDSLSTGARIVTLLLPVEVDAAPAIAAAAADENSVDAVVGLGLATGSSAIRIERLFANLYEHDRLSIPLVDGAPDGLFSDLPVKQMAAAAAAAGVTVHQSMTAGLYVCNALGFRLRQSRPAIPSGFIHLPMTPGPETGALPTVALEILTTGVTAMLEAVEHWLVRESAAGHPSGPTSGNPSTDLQPLSLQL